MKLQKYYTSPAFAETLKKHGINIETIFGYSLAHKRIVVIERGLYHCPVSNCYYQPEDVAPVYLLQQVIDWLPKEIEDPTRYEPHFLTPYLTEQGGMGLSYEHFQSHAVLYDQNLKVHYDANSIEGLVTFGLEKGWLEPETITYNAKYSHL